VGDGTSIRVIGGHFSGGRGSLRRRAPPLSRDVVADYALIGDLRTAALVHRNGTIAWWCVPRFDSPAVFAALLGNTDSGSWSLGPQDSSARSVRRYRGETFVLETTHATPTGTVRVVDFMPLGAAQPAIVRIVEGLAGSVRCVSTFAPKMKYGLLSPSVEINDDSWIGRVAPAGLCLRSSVARDDFEGGSRAVFDIAAGERAVFTLASFDSYGTIPEPLDASHLLSATEAWWLEWSAGIRYEGEWRSEVVRSALTLKALSYGPTGAFVAAATTSLPEELGGSKNWDYRYCWLRDTSFTVDALARVGCVDEARRFCEWFDTICVGTPEQLHIMYAVDGERITSERPLPWLGGFADSPPVRIGNNAHDQFQLGVFGNVVMAYERAQRHGFAIRERDWATVEALMSHVESVWQCPGNGIWETRAGGRQYVTAKTMAWVAVRRGIDIARRGGFATDDERWEKLAARIHAEVCRAGFDPARSTFTQYYGSSELDASALLMPLVGFIDARHPHFAGTVAAIERELLRDGYVYRYSKDLSFESGDASSPSEGSFTMCGFWLVQVYVAAGRSHDARELFERLLLTANDVGLLSEEYDVENGVAIGNVPQAFSHAGLIQAATALERGMS
jgi:GH15 family glucan-1,4-alpha-glucosidase